MAGGGVEEIGKKRSTIVEKLKARLRRKREKQKQKEEEGEVVVVDGSDIRELVGNEEAFINYVDHKFRELDLDHDGKLSVQEIQQAIIDIGAALGLPARGSSPTSDFID